MDETTHERLRSRPEFFLLIASLAISLGPGLLLFAWSGNVVTEALGVLVMAGGLVLAVRWARLLFGRA